MATIVLCGNGGLPMWPTSLDQSQDIPTGYRSVIYGTLTIPSGVTLTISGTGQLIITNYILTT